MRTDEGRRGGARALTLFGFCGMVAAVAFTGAAVNSPAKRRWYRRLRKPRYNPPEAVFPVAWGALYPLIACSGYRVWRRPSSPARTRALALWYAQMALNAAWAPLFFGLKRTRVALADVGTLIAAIALYAREARRIDAPAAMMMAPYGAWCAFASLLNAEIVRRNP
jgi:translocator protein